MVVGEEADSALLEGVTPFVSGSSFLPSEIKVAKKSGERRHKCPVQNASKEASCRDPSESTSAGSFALDILSSLNAVMLLLYKTLVSYTLIPILFKYCLKSSIV